MRAPGLHRRSAGLALLVIPAAVVVFGLFAWFVVLLWNRAPKPETAEQIRAKERLAKLAEVRERDAKLATLTAPEWADKEKGIVRIPIDRAMELVVRENEGKKPAATDVAVPAAVPAAAPASAASAPAPGTTASAPATLAPTPAAPAAPTPEAAP